MTQSHPYSRKWFFESLFGTLSPRPWKRDEMTRVGYAVAEKFIRTKKMYQSHVDFANMYMNYYLQEILDTCQDVSHWYADEEHVLFFEKIRVVGPCETQNKAGITVRLLPGSCNKRHMSYNAQVMVDVVYKIFKCPVPYPETVVEEKAKAAWAKDWHKMRELRKKAIGRDRYYKGYRVEDTRIHSCLPGVSLGYHPIDMGTSMCHLESPLLQPGEGLQEPFGVKCVGGTYKVIPPLKDLCLNQYFTNQETKFVTLEVWSSAETKFHNSTQTFKLYYDASHDKNRRPKRAISIELPFTRMAINITIVYYALGFNPSDMIFTVRQAARHQWKEVYKDILNVVIQRCPIRTQEEAYLSIAYAEGKKLLNVPKQEIIASAQNKIHQQLLPRLGETAEANSLKARSLGLMIWMLLLEAEKLKANDLAHNDTSVVLQNHQFPIPQWTRVERQGEKRHKKFDRDHLANSRSDFNGVLTATLLRQFLGRALRQIKSHFQATLKINKDVVLLKFFKNIRKLGFRIQYCISTGRWTADRDKECRRNVTQTFAMNGAISQESAQTYHSNSMNSEGKHIGPRQIQESQAFNLCLAETPESKKAGLVTHVAQMAQFSIGSPGIELEKTLRFYDEELCFVPAFRWLEIYALHPDEKTRETAFDPYTHILLNGKPIGYTWSPEQFTRFFLTLRRTWTIDLFASIYYDPILDLIHLRTERGRFTTPFFIFPRLHHLLAKLPEAYRDTQVPPSFVVGQSSASFYAPAFVGPRAQLGLSRKHRHRPVPEDPDLAREREVWRCALPWTHLHSLSLSTLVSQGLVEFLDPSERRMTVLAMNEDDYWERRLEGQMVFTHMAIDPSFMFSITTALTPLIGHNQSPRAVYQGALVKSAADYPLERYVQAKTKHEFVYPQAPLLRTLGYAYRNELLSAIRFHTISAPSPYLTYNNEDSQNYCADFLLRGAGQIVTSKLFRSDLKRKKSSSSREAFGKPKEEECIDMRFANYNNIGEEGVVRRSTLVNCNDVVIAQTSHARFPQARKVAGITGGTLPKRKRKDNSLVYHYDETAVVASSIVGTNLDGNQFAKVVTEMSRFLEKGDKVSTLNAQKATNSYNIATQDMLEVADGSGTIMEHLLNPQAVTKRMTCALPSEQLLSRALVRGFLRYSDGTAFRNQSLLFPELRETLRGFGGSFMGSIMRDGRTGQEIATPIAYGFLGCLRLKHICGDKNHVRSFGPVNPRTRQPVDGRSRLGGLRFGEMERGGLAAHNLALLERQQMYELADPTELDICAKCQLFVHEHKFAPPGTSTCKTCVDGDILKVCCSYAWKLCSQELFGNMIALRTKVEPIDSPKHHLGTSLKESELRQDFETLSIA